MSKKETGYLCKYKGYKISPLKKQRENTVMLIIEILEKNTR